MITDYKDLFMDNTIEVIQDLYDKDGLLDVLISIQEYFDNMDLFAYKNWIEGVLVKGPDVSKYWIDVSFKYYSETFPDPHGLTLLKDHGVIISGTKTYEIQPIEFPRGDGDMSVVGGGNGGAMKKPKQVTVPILIIDFRIPRSLVNPESFDEYKLNNDDFDVNQMLTPNNGQEE